MLFYKHKTLILSKTFLLIANSFNIKKNYFKYIMLLISYIVKNLNMVTLFCGKYTG